jgi:hypothetical protein
LKRDLRDPKNIEGVEKTFPVFLMSAQKKLPETALRQAKGHA